MSATRLRASDALYVWVAMQNAVPLVTLDEEVTARAPIVGVIARAP